MNRRRLFGLIPLPFLAPVAASAVSRPPQIGFKTLPNGAMIRVAVPIDLGRPLVLVHADAECRVRVRGERYRSTVSLKAGERLLVNMDCTFWAETPTILTVTPLI